ncbi:hypothetical protein BH11ACT5_BH11ACT5_02350 [soil metagenome]
MIATDAAAAAALEAQLQQLFAVLERLSSVRSQLVPAKATFWSGLARQVYDGAICDLDSKIESALDVLSWAQRNTSIAIAELAGRG